MLLLTPRLVIVVGCGVVREELEGSDDAITTKLDIELTRETQLVKDHNHCLA